MKKSNMVFIIGAALLMAAATGCSGNKEAKSDQSNNKAQTEVLSVIMQTHWVLPKRIIHSGTARPVREWRPR